MLSSPYQKKEVLGRTKVKPGTLVMLAKDLKDDPKYQISLWENDYHFLRDPFSLKISNVWVQRGDVCVVIKQDYSGITILIPRGHIGWIGKERMEVIK